MLAFDPSERPQIEQIKKHPWVQNSDLPTRDEIRSQMSKLKKAYIKMENQPDVFNLDNKSSSEDNQEDTSTVQSFLVSLFNENRLAMRQIGITKVLPMITFLILLTSLASAMVSEKSLARIMWLQLVSLLLFIVFSFKPYILEFTTYLTARYYSKHVDTMERSSDR